MTTTARKNNGLPLWGVNRDYWVRIGDEPFLDRRVLVICPWFGVFVTEIHKPDSDERDGSHEETSSNRHTCAFHRLPPQQL